MSLKTKRHLNDGYEVRPCYNEALENNMSINVHLQGSNNMTRYEATTYTINKSGLITRLLELKNDQMGQVYNFEVPFNTSKCLDLRSGQDILKLKHQVWTYHRYYYSKSHLLWKKPRTLTGVYHG